MTYRHIAAGALLISSAKLLVDSSQSDSTDRPTDRPTDAGLNLACMRRYVRQSVGVVSDERQGVLYTAAAAAAETIDDVTYRSCTRPVTVAVVTVSS